MRRAAAFALTTALVFGAISAQPVRADNAGAARAWCGSASALAAIDVREGQADDAFDSTGRTSRHEPLLALQRQRMTLLVGTRRKLLASSASSATGGAARRAALRSVRAYERMTLAFEAGAHAFVRGDKLVGERLYTRGNLASVTGQRDARSAARLFSLAGVRTAACGKPCELHKPPRVPPTPRAAAAACRRPAPA